MGVAEEVVARLKSEVLKARLKSRVRSTVHEGHEILPNLRPTDEGKVRKHRSSLVARKNEDSLRIDSRLLNPLHPLLCFVSCFCLIALNYPHFYT
jgi:hypothetical protein